MPSTTWFQRDLLPLALRLEYGEPWDDNPNFVLWRQWVGVREVSSD